LNTLFETGGDSAATTHDWLTPPEIIRALGPFDLDPCASQHQPWRTAAKQYTIDDNGLNQKWEGRVYCNPPYGPHAAAFLERCAAHGNAIALIFARTDTQAFQKHIFPKAHALLFIEGRLLFRLPGGGNTGAGGRAGAPSVLVAYGANNVLTLQYCGIKGALVRLRIEDPNQS
jgi:hypothetical protein